MAAQAERKLHVYNGALSYRAKVRWLADIREYTLAIKIALLHKAQAAMGDGVTGWQEGQTRSCFRLEDFSDFNAAADVWLAARERRVSARVIRATA